MRRRLAVAFAAVMTVAAGCGVAADTAGDATASAAPERTTAPPDEQTPTPRAQQSSRPVPVPDILDFTGTTSEGSTFAAAALAGEPVLLWFWAPWCPICRSQISTVQGVARDFGDELQVVGVGGLDSGSAIEGFADDATGVTHLVDDAGEIWQRFGIIEQSSYVLLDSAGEVVFTSGYGDEVDLIDEIEQVVG